jgi:hypothetical protein
MLQSNKAGNSHSDDVSVLGLGIQVRQQKEKQSGKTNRNEQHDEDVCDRHA